jgi:hypothetical protein
MRIFCVKPEQSVWSAGLGEADVPVRAIEHGLSYGAPWIGNFPGRWAIETTVRDAFLTPAGQ